MKLAIYSFMMYFNSVTRFIDHELQFHVQLLEYIVLLSLCVKPKRNNNISTGRVTPFSFPYHILALALIIVA